MRRHEWFLLAAIFLISPLLGSDEKYKAGVKSFLEGDSQKAIGLLTDVVTEDASNEKAKTLLLKLYVKEINASLAAKNYSHAKKMHQIAVAQFPNDANLILLGTSFKAPAPPRPVEKKRAAAPPVKEVPAAAMPVVEKILSAPFLWLILGTSIFILIASFIFVLILDRRKLWQKIELHDERLQKKEAEVQVAQREVQNLRAQVLQKDELLRARQAPRPVPVPVSVPVPIPVSAPVIKERPVRPAPAPLLDYAQYQQQQILDIVVDAPSLVKREAWQRISERTMSLYETSAPDAIRFLEQLAADTSALVRTSMIMSLERIATPETLDIMLRMLKDPDFNVQREVLKGLKTILLEKADRVPEAYRQKIQTLLEKEVQDGGWVV